MLPRLLTCILASTLGCDAQMLQAITNSSPHASSTIAADGSGCKNNTGSAATLAITCSVNSGDTVTLFLETATSASSAPSCLDNNSNALTAGPTKITNTSTIIYSFYVLSAPSGVTSYTCNWTNSAVNSAMVQAYTGVGSINPSLANNTGGGTSATSETLTVSLEDANDWIVCGISDTSTSFTAVTGTQRQAVVAGGARAMLLDNTSASTGSISCATSSVSTQWAGAVIELKHS